MNEIVTKTGLIEFDFEALKKYLDDQLSDYRGLVFTEDAKKDAKATVADLRKQKKEFSDRIKEVKQEYMIPYIEFEIKAKDIVSLYDQPIEFISGQIEDFEKKRIEEKNKVIKEIYNEYMTGMYDVLPLEKIFDKKWQNATCSKKQITDDMVQLKNKVKADMRTIQLQNSDIEADAIANYLEFFDLNEALDMIRRDSIRKEAILEQQRMKEIELERSHEREIVEMEMEHEAEKDQIAQNAVAALIPDMEGEETEYEYRIMLTEDAKEKLNMYLDSIGIEYDFNIAF